MKVPPSTTPRQSSGTVVGRILARQLVTLTCRVCGRDLLPMLAQALVSGCPCHRTSTLRRVH